MDAVGQMERVEEVVGIAALPAAAKTQVEKDVGAGKLLKVEAIMETGKPTIYEAQFEAGGHRSEIKLGADGKVLARE